MCLVRIVNEMRKAAPPNSSTHGGDRRASGESYSTAQTDPPVGTEFRIPAAFFEPNAATLIHSFGSALNEEPEISWTVNYSIVKVIKACFGHTAASPRLLITNHTTALCNEYIDQL